MRFLLPAFLLSCALSAQPDSWSEKADFGGSARANGAAFVIGTKGYVGTGSNIFLGMPHTEFDFWEYDSASDTWTQKDNYGGANRGLSTGFSIGSKGYIGMGYLNTHTRKDLWEYDPAADAWTQKANCPGIARAAAVGFNIGQIGYVGLGEDSLYAPLNDLWAYDPVSDTWSEMAPFPGDARAYAVGFSIGNKGYVGTGGAPDQYLNDFWEYDPASNAWTQLASFPGPGRHFAVGFAIAGKGYIGTGLDANGVFQDFAEYDPSSDTWTPRAVMPGSLRSGAMAFGIGDAGFIIAGRGMFLNLLPDVWSYEPALSEGIDEPATAVEGLRLFPVPTTDVVQFNCTAAALLQVMDPAGREVMSEHVAPGQVQVDLSTLPTGTYVLQLRDGTHVQRGVCMRL